MKINYFKLFSYFLLFILLIFYFKKISKRYENFYSPPNKIQKFNRTYALMARGTENIDSESEAIKYVNQQSDQIISKTLKRLNNANNENTNEQLNPINQSNSQIDKSIHLISYQDSLFKIDINFQIYQCFFDNSKWFLVFRNYDQKKATDLCIINDQGKDYLYVLFENTLCRRFLNNYDSEWEVLNEENLYLDTFRKLQCLTNIRDTLLFLVNKNINSNPTKLGENENQMDKKDLFNLNINGIYQYSLKAPKLTLWNDKKGEYKKTNINTASINNIGYLNVPSFKKAIDKASSLCSNKKFFRIQYWNNNFIGACSNDFKIMTDYDFCINNNCNINNINYIYEKRKTNVQPMLLSSNYYLIRFNNYDDKDEFYGLYKEDARVIVVKKNSLRIDSSTPYDNKFLFGDDDFQFLDLFITQNYLYGLGSDGFIYRKLILTDVFGIESIVWNKITSRCPNYTKLLKDNNRYSKKMTIINNFIFCFDGEKIRKHYLDIGYQWVNINNIDYINNFYPTSPYKIIQQIHEKTNTKKSILNKEINKDNSLLLNQRIDRLNNTQDDINQDLNLSTAFYNTL